MKSAEYLAAVKARLNITSDYALAKALKVSKQMASKYTDGAIPGPVVAFRIAEILGDQPAAVIADLEAERAESMGKEDDADYLRRVLKKLGGTAATILVAMGMGGLPSNGAGSQPASSVDCLHIASNRKRKPRPRRAGPFDGLMRSMAMV